MVLVRKNACMSKFYKFLKIKVPELGLMIFAQMLHKEAFYKLQETQKSTSTGLKIIYF